MGEQHEKINDVYYELRDMIDLRIANYINRADTETRNILEHLRNDVSRDVDRVWKQVVGGSY